MNISLADGPTVDRLTLCSHNTKPFLDVAMHVMKQKPISVIRFRKSNIRFLP